MTSNKNRSAHERRLDLLTFCFRPTVRQRRGARDDSNKLPSCACWVTVLEAWGDVNLKRAAGGGGNMRKCPGTSMDGGAGEATQARAGEEAKGREGA